MLAACRGPDDTHWLLSRLSALLFSPRRSRERAQKWERWEALAGRAGARAVEVLANEALLLEARREVGENAARAEREIDAFFSEAARHKAHLEAWVKAARKSACQPASDSLVSCHVLRRVLYSASAFLPMDVPVAAQHLQLVHQGAPTNPAQHWGLKLAVGPAAHNHSEWEARTGARSQPLPSLNAARFCLAGAASSNGRVYAMGGKACDGSKLGSCERLDSERGAWHTQPNQMGTARAWLAACVVGNTLVVVGGKDTGGEVRNVVEGMDIETGAWRELPPFPTNTSGGGVVSVGDWIVVVGGGENWLGTNAVWGLHVGQATARREPAAQSQQQQHHHHQQRWLQLPSMLSPRSLAGTATGGGHVFACGGCYNLYASRDTCEMVDFTHLEHATPDHGAQGDPPLAWERLPQMPVGLHAPGCCYGGGNLFVVGGFAHPNYLSAVLALNLGSRAWTEVGRMRSARYGCTAVCVGRRVIVMGGNFNGTFLASCEEFDFAGGADEEAEESAAEEEQVVVEREAMVGA